MRRIILLTGLAIILFTSCEHRHEPIADFSVNYTLVIPGEVVFFTNNSSYAERVEWDFGDGYASTDFSPNHYYSNEGVYEVRLAAYGDGYVDYSYMSIEVYETTLEVEVREYYSENLIPNVEITLFDNYDDWYNLNFDYKIISGYTDLSGTVIFKGLETIPYYIDAYNQYYDNNQLAQEDVGFIKTLPLTYATHNIFTAYVDYYPAGTANQEGFKSTERKRTIVIKEIKRIYKDKITEVK